MRFEPIIANCLVCLMFFVSSLPAVKTSFTGGGMKFEHGDISLVVSSGLDITPSLVDGGRELSFVESDITGRPSFYAVFGGLEVTDFEVDWDAVKSETVDTPGLGRGVRYDIPARAEQYGGHALRAA